MVWYYSVPTLFKSYGQAMDTMDTVYRRVVKYLTNKWADVPETSHSSLIMRVLLSNHLTRYIAVVISEIIGLYVIAEVVLVVWTVLVMPVVGDGYRTPPRITLDLVAGDPLIPFLRPNSCQNFPHRTNQTNWIIK